jgi:hypothetical protein
LFSSRSRPGEKFGLFEKPNIFGGMNGHFLAPGGGLNDQFRGAREINNQITAGQRGMNDQIPGEGGMDDQFPGRTEMQKKPDPTLLKFELFFRASVVFIARKRGLNDQFPGNGRNKRKIPRSKRNEQPNPAEKRNERPFPGCSTYI